MKIFSAAQIKKWDEYTIAHEPILSIDLMERAATTCCKWLIGKNMGLMPFRIFCGKGNNGGDFYLGQGIHSVPAIIINDRHLISGGQPAEVFEQALRKIAAES